MNAKAGIKMNKNFYSLVAEAGEHENLPFLEKDCRNHMDKVKHLELKEGDVVAMNKYFLKCRPTILTSFTRWILLKMVD